jgi:hypothetical protein
MRVLVKAAVIAAALGASAVASASNFDFSYAFTDGQKITGSLEGMLSGTTISDISDISLALDGTPFSGGVGPLQIVAWNTATTSYDDTIPATISTIGSQNNFGIADVDLASATASDYFFTYVNDAHVGGVNVEAANFTVTDPDGNKPQAFDFTGTGWQVSAVSPVPLPASLPMLLSGLGLLGVGRRFVKASARA